MFISVYICDFALLLVLLVFVSLLGEDLFLFLSLTLLGGLGRDILICFSLVVYAFEAACCSVYAICTHVFMSVVNTLTVCKSSCL